MKTLVIAMLIAVALCVSSAAAAEEPDWYAGFAGGRFWPDASSPSGPKKELDPGPIGELRIGRRVRMGPADRGLAVEMSFGGFHVEGDTSNPVNVTETTLQTLSATWLATTVKGWHRLGSDRWRASAGLGMAYYRFDAGLKDPPSARRDASESDLGAHFVAGVEFDVAPRIGIVLEDRWVSVTANEAVMGNGNAAAYAASGNAALLGAVYRF